MLNRPDGEDRCMNRAPGSGVAAFLAVLLLCGSLARAQEQPAAGGDLNYRPQPESNARGTPPGQGNVQGWTTQNPDGSQSFHFERSWSYGNRPGQAQPAAPGGQPGMQAGGQPPPGQQPGWQGAGQPQTSPWPQGGAPQGPPQSWPGGAGYGQPQQPWGGAGPQAGSPYGWPGQQGWQGQQPYAQQPSHGTGAPPQLEVSLQEGSAYIHQNLVLVLEVVSDLTLSTISVDLPQTERVILREIGEASAKFRTKGNRREIVNRLHYLLTPVQEGEIEIPALRVSGKNEKGQDYQASAKGPLRLKVLPSDPSVNPWLPLKDLALSAHLLNDNEVAEGQPITLVVEQVAEGMTGGQLPSLEHKLRSKLHRLYREKTETDGRISTEGKLIGKRVDHFTLVPQKGNQVQIPAVSVDWWNAVKNRKETAIIPGRLLGGGELLGDLKDKIQDIQQSGVLSWRFWLPLLIVAFAVGFYWRWLWARLRPVSRVIGVWAAAVTYPLRRRLRYWSERFAPRRLLHQGRRWFANSLPRPFRLWYCVRAADQEQDPDDWAQVLRFLLNRRLGISAQRPMAQLAEDIIALHRGANPEQVRQLMRELEAGLFSQNGQVRDFRQWKKAFKRQIRPSPLRLLRFSRRRGLNRLPELNPV